MSLTNLQIIFLGFLSLAFTSKAITEHEYIENILNICLDSQHHKSDPGPEDSLHAECAPWKELSCCTKETSRNIHLTTLYNFNYDHCKKMTNKPMSSKCRRRFQQDHCFYECSPNIGPWIVKENRTWRNERYYKIPLCKSDCDAWFNDCEDDYTCTDRWSSNFQWVNGNNICPTNSVCKTFREIFGDAKNFCETVWDDAWEFKALGEPCMRLWFNGTAGNPNVGVTKLFAKKQYRARYASSSCGTINMHFSLFLLLLLKVLL